MQVKDVVVYTPLEKQDRRREATAEVVKVDGEQITIKTFLNPTNPLIVNASDLEIQNKFPNEITLNQGFTISVFGYGLWDVSEAHFKGAKEYGILEMIRAFKLRHSSFRNFRTREVSREWNGSKDNIAPIGKIWEDNWDKVEAYSPSEVFKIENLNYRRFCFNYLSPGDLMKHLGATKVKFAHKDMDYFEYDAITHEKRPAQRRNEYITYEMEASKLDPELEGFIYAVKCWCTSTEEEHWLWINEQYKDDPLEAIASTFMVHENVIPYVTALKRQGDIMLIETSKQVTPEGEEVSLTKEQYFELLVCES